MNRSIALACSFVLSACSSEDGSNSIDAAAVHDASLPDAASTLDAAVNSRWPGRCQPGFYAGGFEGEVDPEVYAFGGAANAFRTHVLGDAAAAAVSFTIAEPDDAGQGRLEGCFAGDGVLGGELDGGSAPHPAHFTARFTGELDCATGHLTGRLAGVLGVLAIPGVDFVFTGQTTSSPMPPARFEGRWRTREPRITADRGLGTGRGTWSAEHLASEPPRDFAPCARLAD